MSWGHRVTYAPLPVGLVGSTGFIWSMSVSLNRVLKESVLSFVVFWSPTMTRWKSLTSERPKSSVTKAQRCPSLAQWPGWRPRWSGMSPCLKKWTSGEFPNDEMTCSRWCSCCEALYCALQVFWSCVMGAANRRDSLQRCGLLCHHLGCRQQQSPPPCPLHLSRWFQNPHETNMVTQ